MKKFNNIVVIGCGGTGSWLLAPLVRWCESLIRSDRPSRLYLIDGDNYSAANAGRQEFAMHLVGTNKALAQAKRYSTLYPSTFDGIFVVDQYVGEGNVKDVIPESTIVFNCCDNHVCRAIVAKHCETLSDVLLITAGNELTDGNVQLYSKCKGKEEFPSIFKAHPELATTKDGDRSAMSCAEIEKLPSGGQIIFTNLTAATMMLWLAHSYLSNETSEFSEIYFDIKRCAVRSVKDTVKGK